jgi:hypothetical protein
MNTFIVGAICVVVGALGHAYVTPLLRRIVATVKEQLRGDA